MGRYKILVRGRFVKILAGGGGGPSLLPLGETLFIKHLLLTLFLAHRGLLMGRIKKKQTIIQLKIYKNLMERYFA